MTTDRPAPPRLKVGVGPSTHTLPDRTGSSTGIRHVWEKEVIEAVDSALAIGRILLIEGEPGVGKSQIAKAAAVELGWRFAPTAFDAWTETRDLYYDFDQVRRLGDAQVQGKGELPIAPYLTPGVLWWAFDADRAHEIAPDDDESPDGRSGVVVLLDEIDKAEREVPNGLLRALDELEFDSPLGDVKWSEGSGQPVPLVVATTNDERELPDAFVRRSLVLRLHLPKEENGFKDLLRARARARYDVRDDDDPFLGVLEEVLRDLWTDRTSLATDSWPGPGQAEFFDMLEILRSRFRSDEDRMDAIERVRAFVFQKRRPERR